MKDNDSSVAAFLAKVICNLWNFLCNNEELNNIQKQLLTRKTRKEK